MYLLDTDHITAIERGGVDAQRLLARLASVPQDELGVTIISYEEQTRGWLAYMAKARSITAQVEALRRLRRHLENYCTIPLVDFDSEAAQVFQQLRKSNPRLGTMDLKIAAIALSNDATLLTRNLADFTQVADLRAEDWTV